MTSRQQLQQQQQQQQQVDRQTAAVDTTDISAAPRDAQSSAGW